MRKVAIVALVVSLACLALTASANPAPVGVRYDWQGTHGVLSIADASGLGYMAWSSNGAVVAQGVAWSSMVRVPALNTGMDAQGVILRVRVGDVLFQISGEVDPKWSWE